MAQNTVTVKKIEKLQLTVRLSRGFRMRIALAVFLIRLAGMVLGGKTKAELDADIA